MTKIYLATQQSVSDVNADVTIINSQINTPATGLLPRVQAVENKGVEIDTLRTDVDNISLQIDDPTNGIIATLVGMDTQLNATGTGVVSRLEDLEQGGSTTIKFRTHSPSGAYEDGEVVQRNGRIYKAVGVIDGSIAPVAFVEGVFAGQWTEVSPSELPDYILGSQVDSGQVIADADRFVHNDNGIMRQTSFTRVWNWIVGKITGAASTVITSDLTVSRALASNAQGKIIASDISDTELGYLDNVSSNIQNQINGKKPNYTNMYQMQSYGTVNGQNGSRVSGTGFSVTRAGEGHYRIFNLPYMDINTAMIQLQSVSDPDNMYCLYDVGTNEFWVRFYDAPNMGQQDIDFRFIISRLV